MLTPERVREIRERAAIYISSSNKVALLLQFESMRHDVLALCGAVEEARRDIDALNGTIAQLRRELASEEHPAYEAARAWRARCTELEDRIAALSPTPSAAPESEGDDE